MSLFALGVSHRHAGLEVREKFAFSSGEIPQVVQTLCAHRAVEEAVVLSTCNRTEIYTVTKCHHAVKEWLRNAQQRTACYELQDESVVTHLMQVASGVDSMIIGESQILGQLRQAYQVACKEGAVGRRFKHLFPAVFATAKKVRAQTNIGAHPVTWAYAVMQLAKPVLPNLEACVVLLIGAGETIELLADYLSQRRVKRLVIMNRTVEKAHEIACRYNGIPVGFDNLDLCLQEADWVVSATASPQPLLKYETVGAVLASRQYKPMVLTDLAVPRDIEPRVAELESVQVYNLDDVQRIVTGNQQSRFVAADAARVMIEMESAHYMRLLRVREAGDMIRRYREKMTDWQNQALAKATQQLAVASDPQAVLAEFGRDLTNKFMHQPTLKLRQAAYAERGALLDLLKEIYEL